MHGEGVIKVVGNVDICLRENKNRSSTSLRKKIKLPTFQMLCPEKYSKKLLLTPSSSANIVSSSVTIFLYWINEFAPYWGQGSILYLFIPKKVDVQHPNNVHSAKCWGLVWSEAHKLTWSWALDLDLNLNLVYLAKPASTSASLRNELPKTIWKSHKIIHYINEWNWYAQRLQDFMIVCCIILYSKTSCVSGSNLLQHDSGFFLRRGKTLQLSASGYSWYGSSEMPWPEN